MTLANDKFPKKWIVERIYKRIIYEINPNGTARSGEIKPKIPVTKIKNITVGINKRIKIFAGIETRDKTPVR